MGTVHKAKDRDSNGDYIAIKLLNDNFKAHPSAVTSLKRECVKARNLKHENIVGVYNFSHERNSKEVYMVMEYLQGMPLNTLLEQHRGTALPKEQALSILKGICAGLSFAHNRKVVHSDLKPGNIFIIEKEIAKKKGAKNKGVKNKNTELKEAKILDFGLARVLSDEPRLNESKSDESKIFDPATLGGLTPAYASLEIQQREPPTFSDDIYALGCIAYQLFTGHHPFDKLSASEAQEQGLKPKRIKCLSRRQWNAIENALAFTKDKRISSVELFSHCFFKPSKTPLITAALLLLLIPIGFGLLSYIKTHNLEEEASKLQKQYESLQEKQRIQDEQREKEQAAAQQQKIAEQASEIKNKLSSLIVSPSLDEDWALNIQQLIVEYKTLMPADMVLDISVKQEMSSSLLMMLNTMLNKDGLTEEEIETAENILKKSQFWQEEAKFLLTEMKDLDIGDEYNTTDASLLSGILEAKSHIDNKRQQFNDAVIAKETAKKAANIAQQIRVVQKSAACNNNLDIKGSVNRQLKKLKLLDPARERQQRPIIASMLAKCIKASAARNFNWAASLKKDALTVLSEQKALRNVKIDRCAYLSPGSGAKKRNFCRDSLVNSRLLNKEQGPSMVIVPIGSGKRIAISKYEITGHDFKIYCKSSGECSNAIVYNDWWPVHNISIAQVKSYLSWLGRQSGYQYRLPRYDEWLSASSRNNQQSSAARNCYLKYGAINKGDTLIRANSGVADGYGLFNTIGNVREFVYDNSGKLLAVGGSRKTPMSQCSSKRKISHKGQADMLTGFRVVRDVSR